MRTLIFSAVAMSVILTTAQVSEAKGKKEAKLEIASTSFKPGEEIPKKFTADGEDVSPQISIAALPSGTQSLALSCEDPDAPVGTWFHWLVWDISPLTTEMKEGVATKAELEDGSKQGQNDFKKTGYNGPSPPKGPAHHYHFKVFALDKKIGLEANSDKNDFYKAIEGHVLGTGEVVGIYGRK